MEDGGKPTLHKGRPTLEYIRIQNLEKFKIDPLEYFIGRREYNIVPKPIKCKVKIKGNKIKNIFKDTWCLIKELFNREHVMICNLDWKSDEGREIDILLLAYGQINAEEEKRVHDEMNKQTKDSKK